jgi:hypothetical protein
MNAKAGEPIAKLTKFTRPELVTTIRTWREQITVDLSDESSVHAEANRQQPKNIA